MCLLKKIELMFEDLDRLEGLGSYITIKFLYGLLIFCRLNIGRIFEMSAELEVNNTLGLRGVTKPYHELQADQSGPLFENLHESCIQRSKVEEMKFIPNS